MRRRLFTLCSAVSLLLCVAVCVLWARSYYRRDSLTWLSFDGTLELPETYWRELWTSQGRLLIRTGRETHSRATEPGEGRTGRPYATIPDPPGMGWSFATEPTPREPAAAPGAGPAATDGAGVWRRLGFARAEHEYSNSGSRTYEHHAVAPVWALLPPLAVLPGFYLVRAVRARHRLQLCRCAACGYDLRATPDRCPECGASSARTSGSPSSSNGMSGKSNAAR